MKKVLLFFLGIATAGLATLFAIENSSLASVSLFNFQSTQLPLFVWLAITFSGGLFLGLLVAIVIFFRTKARERKITEDLDNCINNSLNSQKERKHENE